MATVRRKILIDAPASAVYQLWCDPPGYPRFIPELEKVVPLGERGYLWCPAAAAEAPYAARLAEAVSESRICWSSSEARWSRLLITFASLAGPSAWVVCEAQSAVEASPTSIAALHRLANDLGRWLSNAQQLVESAWATGEYARPPATSPETCAT